MLIAAGMLLFYAQPWADWTGLAMLAAAVVWHWGHSTFPMDHDGRKRGHSTFPMDHDGKC